MAKATITDEQKRLRAFIKRRHPEYAAKECHWDFLEATYDGGRAWFGSNIFRYLKEGDREFSDRLNRAYRFNHTREVVDLVQKYIFKSPITRGDDAPQELKDFWENATLTNLSINEFMKLVSTDASKLGRCYICVDTTATEQVVSVADAKLAKARAYAYTIKPQDALDMGFSEDGVMQWILVREFVRDDVDPINSTGAVSARFRLWTTTFSQTFTVQWGKSGKVEDYTVVPGPEVPHNLDIVPVFPVNHVISECKYASSGLIDDIAYLDRACANYLSNMDAIIQDQSFSQLVIPAQALMPGTDPYKQLMEMGTKRMFAYDGEGGAKPEYISPDVRQAQLIVTVINKIIGEIYHTIGMAGERTKEDNSMGIDNSSGVAKAYDFERMNSLLTSKADALESAENQLADLVMRLNGQKKGLDGLKLVKYPDTFDVRSLFDEFTISERLALVDAPPSIRREQMKQVIEKLFPRLAADLKQAMLDDLKDWPMTTADMMTITATMGGNDQPSKFPASAKQTTQPLPGGGKGPPPPKEKAASEKKQGQVTDKTK